jgi:hypothetical protein
MSVPASKTKEKIRNGSGESVTHQDGEDSKARREESHSHVEKHSNINGGLKVMSCNTNIRTAPLDWSSNAATLSCGNIGRG